MRRASGVLRKLTWQSISEAKKIISALFRLGTECLRWLDVGVFVFQNVNMVDGIFSLSKKNVPLTGLTLPFDDRLLKHPSDGCSAFSSLQTCYLNLVVKVCSLFVSYYRGVINYLWSISKFMRRYCHALSPFCDENGALQLWAPHSCLLKPGG